MKNKEYERFGRDYAKTIARLASASDRDDVAPAGTDLLAGDQVTLQMKRL